MRRAKSRFIAARSSSPTTAASTRWTPMLFPNSMPKISRESSPPPLTGLRRYCSWNSPPRMERHCACAISPAPGPPAARIAPGCPLKARRRIIFPSKIRSALHGLRNRSWANTFRLASGLSPAPPSGESASPSSKPFSSSRTNSCPGEPSAFFASLVVVARFGIGAIVVLAFCVRTLRTITRAEIWEGVGLAFFGGLGILFQMDGLAHTSASTSAFLTQFYCLLIPIWAAMTQRALPTFAVIVSSALVLAGAAILANFNLREMKIGRGEAETLIASTFFAGQILWLEKPEFAHNRTSHFTFVMFAGTALARAAGRALLCAERGRIGYALRGLVGADHDLCARALLHRRSLRPHEHLAAAHHRDRGRLDLLPRACRRFRLRHLPSSDDFSPRRNSVTPTNGSRATFFSAAASSSPPTS